MSRRVFLVFYPMVSKTILTIYNCQEVGDKYYLVKDRKVQCYDEAWFFYGTIATGGVFVWVLGVPLAFWLILYRARHRNVSKRIEILKRPDYARLRQKWLVEIKEKYAQEGKHWDPVKFHAIEDELLAKYMKQKNLDDSTVVSRVGFIYHSCTYSRLSQCLSFAHSK